MDEKRNNIRLVRSDGRRITENTTEHKRTDRRQQTSFEQKITYQKRQKERRMRAKRFRTLLALVILTAVVAVLLFLTPVFNIRSLSVEGNYLVPDNDISTVLKPLIGENILRTGDKKIVSILKQLAYIDTVTVEKKMFPPEVSVYITEYNPAAIIRADNRNLIVSADLHDLEETTDQLTGVPVVTGVEIAEHKEGGVVKLTDPNSSDALITALSTLEDTGIIGNIKEIDIRNLSYIIMNYDNRITVQCGSQLDLERKLRLLKEAVTSDSISVNARGTINLSELGKAVYTP